MDTHSEYANRRIQGPEAAAMIGIDMPTLRRLVRSRRIPACQVTRKVLTLRVMDVERFIEANYVRPACQSAQTA